MAGTDSMSACAGTGDRHPGLVMMGARGRARPQKGLRWFFSAVWLAYLVAPVAGLFSRHHSPLWIAGGLAITVMFCAVYVALLATWDRYLPRKTPLMLSGLAILYALAILASLVYGADWTTSLWVYVSAATGFVLPARRSIALRTVLGVTGCYAVLSWITHVPLASFLAVLLPVALIGLAMIGFRMQILLTIQLRQARETVASLAANEERLRLARDMHDLTGQSLSLITLKSDLAARRLGALPESAARDAALAEVAEIGRVSRQTLHDIREAVSGYRRPTLAVETITARTSLESAGIHLDEDPALTMRSGTFGPEAEAALAWCLREAATNVIRHSGASTCRVRLTEHAGEFSLEVSDDGQGLTGAAVPGGADGGGTDGGGADAGGPPHTGSGLHGMSERLSALGGRLSLGPAGRGGRGLKLVATVPGTPAPAGQAEPGALSALGADVRS